MDARPELVVSNSGPLIALATIGKLGLLEGLLKQVAIPLAVYEEVVTHGQGEAGSQAVAEASWIQALKPEGPTGELAGFYKLRAGDYQVIYEILPRRGCVPPGKGAR